MDRPKGRARTNHKSRRYLTQPRPCSPTSPARGSLLCLGLQAGRNKVIRSGISASCSFQREGVIRYPDGARGHTGTRRPPKPDLSGVHSLRLLDNAAYRAPLQQPRVMTDENRIRELLEEVL